MQTRPVACLSTLSTTYSSISALSCTSQWASSSAWHVAACVDAPSHLTEEASQTRPLPSQFVDPPNQFLLPFPEVLGKAGRVEPVTAERVQRHYRDKLCRTACTVAQVVCLQNVLMCSLIHTVKQTQKYKQHTRWIIVHTIKRRPWLSQCLMGGTEQWLRCLYYFKENTQTGHEIYKLCRQKTKHKSELGNREQH